jgi:hypothetical protein
MQSIFLTTSDQGIGVQLLQHHHRNIIPTANFCFRFRRRPDIHQIDCLRLKCVVNPIFPFGAIQTGFALVVLKVPDRIQT